MLRSAALSQELNKTRSLRSQGRTEGTEPTRARVASWSPPSASKPRSTKTTNYSSPRSTPSSNNKSRPLRLLSLVASDHQAGPPKSLLQDPSATSKPPATSREALRKSLSTPRSRSRTSCLRYKFQKHRTAETRLLVELS